MFHVSAMRTLKVLWGRSGGGTCGRRVEDTQQECPVGDVYAWSAHRTPGWLVLGAWVARKVVPSAGGDSGLRDRHAPLQKGPEPDPSSAPPRWGPLKVCVMLARANPPPGKCLVIGPGGAPRALRHTLRLRLPPGLGHTLTLSSPVRCSDGVLGRVTG